MKGDFHVRFGERDGETHSSRDGKVRSVSTLLMLVMVGLWNTTHERAVATNTIITDNVPTAAQP